MDEFEGPIDKIIRQAREKGAFDNLPGKGQPLRWEDETQVPEDQRLANRLLKNNNFTLDWIQLGQELDAAHEQALAELAAARAARDGGQMSLSEWRDFAGRRREKIHTLNRRVLSYNLRVPHVQFQRKPYPIDSDIKDALE